MIDSLSGIIVALPLREKIIESTMTDNPLKVFISYRWEDEAHNRWVEQFAFDLRSAVIDAKLDKWEVRLGDSFTDYMTSKISEANIVLFIMTSSSVAAAESPKGEGGAVKFEMQMAKSRNIAGEDMRLIGIYREGDKNVAHLRDHRYADFRDDSKYNSSLRELIDDLLGKDKRPPLKSIRNNTSSRQVIFNFNAGAFFINSLKNNGSIDVGWLNSTTHNLIFYADAEEVSKMILTSDPFEVIHTPPVAIPPISISSTFNENFIELSKVYNRPIEADKNEFDCIISFNSGRFSATPAQQVYFYEMDGDQRKIGRKAINASSKITVYFEVPIGQSLKILNKKTRVCWWSSDGVKEGRRIDIDVMGNHDQAFQYYKEVLRLNPREFWYMPSSICTPYIIS